MNQPIKTGDLCEVVGGLMGAKSPNLGLIVRALEFRGEHSQLGRMWRCEAEYAELSQPGVDVPPGAADFAQDWLRRIDPPPNTQTTRTETPRTKELTP